MRCEASGLYQMESVAPSYAMPSTSGRQPNALSQLPGRSVAGLIVNWSIAVTGVPEIAVGAGLGISQMPSPLLSAAQNAFRIASYENALKPAGPITGKTALLVPFGWIRWRAASSMLL